MKKRIFWNSIAILMSFLLLFSNFNYPQNQALASLETSDVVQFSNPEDQTNVYAKTYIIGVKKDVDLDQLIDQKGWKDKTPKKVKATNILIAQLDSDELNNLNEDEDVEFIEEDVPVKTTSLGKTSQGSDYIKKDSQTYPWGINSIGANLSLENKSDGNGTKLAILDTGIADHPDLKVKGGVSFVDKKTSYVDDNGHGTHVTGTIAALDNNSGVVGVAQKSDIYAVKVLDNNGYGTISQVIQGIEWSMNNDINIVSMSFGTLKDSKALHDIIIQANDKGLLLVAAAGNGGPGEETETYPARYSEVISVGAVTQAHQITSYSSTGSEIDVVAPGDGILSTTSDGEYGFLSGTSMAVPHVSGAAAVIWSEHKGISNEDVKQILYNSATPIGDMHDAGHGLVNLAKALGLVNGPIPPVVDEPKVPISITKPKPSFDSKQKEVQFSGFKNKLLNFQQMAMDSNNLSLAKEIDKKYNELLIRDINLSSLPDNLKLQSKEQSVMSDLESQINLYYLSKASEFRDLEYDYQQTISEFSNQLFGVTSSVYISNQTINLNTPIDVDLQDGASEVFQFTPSSTDTYQIYTGPYGGNGSSSDTYLELYSDANLTNMINFDDDSAGDLFSRITTTLNAGSTYYIHLRPYDVATQSPACLIML